MQPGCRDLQTYVNRQTRAVTKNTVVRNFSFRLQAAMSERKISLDAS